MYMLFKSQKSAVTTPEKTWIMNNHAYVTYITCFFFLNNNSSNIDYIY